MDAGGLAQMTYNNFNSNGGLGAPGSSFSSRGKGGHIKRLSVAPPPKINSIYEDEVDANPPPRTSRSHLLAGLRTAPKPQQPPASAPFNQTQHHGGFDTQSFSGRNQGRFVQEVPHTAMAAQFPTYNNSQFGMGVGPQMYCLPEQVLAPPALNPGDGEYDQLDPQTYDELMATNLYLVQRQQQLQQQLVNVTAAAQQFQGMNLNTGRMAPPVQTMPQTSLYNQQLQNGVQPIIQPVPNQPGVFSVYNPMTGQHSFVMDQSAGNNQAQVSPPLGTPAYSSSSPESESPAQYRRDSSPFNSGVTAGKNRTDSPPKTSSSPPQEVTPLPPPSANAYRPGHRKSMSSFGGNTKSLSVDSLKSPGPKTSGFPNTPNTGTFGPGMARAGEHPVRQPRGPPPLEELVASPTSKHEGSKNFATRQRRRAVHNLVRAGKERRVGRSSNGDAATPTSEGEINFGSGSDADSETSGSAQLDGQPSIGDLRGSTSGAIGSEWKEMKERSRERTPKSFHASTASFNGTDNTFTGFQADGQTGFDDMQSTGRRNMAKLILTSAEKRKSAVA